MTSPISKITSLTIGAVESVTSDEIDVVLDIDSPRSTALNTGVPTHFPRINSFVLFPNESGSIVGIVVWLGLEKSAYPKRQGLKDFSLIDLPFPLRKMKVSPIGTLLTEIDEWKLDRGVQSFPTVGDSVILPTRDQTKAIVTGQDENRKVPLGSCPTAHDAQINIDPDKLFGRHLAVLGNTGSGKSCTLAALVRSAIESAQKEINEDPEKDGIPNARFIVLDPNGEYSKCFQGMATKCRVFQIQPQVSTEPSIDENSATNNAVAEAAVVGDSTSDAEQFVLPAWMWNSSEWAAVGQAAPKVQKPIMQKALRGLKSGSHSNPNLKTRIWGRCYMIREYLLHFGGMGTPDWKNAGSCGSQLLAFEDDIEDFIIRLDVEDFLGADPAEEDSIEIKPLIHSLKILNERIKIVIQKHKKGSSDYFYDFSGRVMGEIIELINGILGLYPLESHRNSSNEDSPVKFETDELAGYLEILANSEGGNSNQSIATLVMRVKAMLGDIRMRDVIAPDKDKEPTLFEWLNNHIGSSGGENGAVAVIDLSLVPYEILHLVIAVSSRLILEALQRHRKIKKVNLPTVLVLEEAHVFVAKRISKDNETPTLAEMCRETFERIAREGRKFGLGLVLSSQRPSELSETVLSQCNSFLLHRITNDRDQDLISRLVPDNTRGLLRELPSLPTRHCILLGIASQVPTLVEIKHLEDDYRPKSDDPDFWKVWTKKILRPIDWDMIVKDWVGAESQSDSHKTDRKDKNNPS